MGPYLQQVFRLGRRAALVEETVLSLCWDEPLASPAISFSHEHSRTPVKVTLTKTPTWIGEFRCYIWTVFKDKVTSMGKCMASLIT
jgi:hypothetical protein